MTDIRISSFLTLKLVEVFLTMVNLGASVLNPIRNLIQSNKLNQNLLKVV